MNKIMSIALFVTFGTVGATVPLNKVTTEISKYAVNIVIDGKETTFMTESVDDRKDLETFLLDYNFKNTTGFQFETVRSVDFKLGSMSQRAENIRKVRYSKQYSDAVKELMLAEMLADERQAIKTWQQVKPEIIERLDALGVIPNSAKPEFVAPALPNADEFDPFADEDEKARLAAEASKGQKPKEQKAS